jgi:DNA-binding NarL/FixJ family response regulator
LFCGVKRDARGDPVNRSEEVERGEPQMSGTSEPNTREALRRQFLEHEQRLRELIERVVGEDPAEPLVRPTPPARTPQLTPRDVEILRLLVLGRTNRQIGSQVSLGPGTVRNHISRIFRKLGVSSRTEAAVRALELGLVRTNNAPH